MATQEEHVKIVVGGDTTLAERTMAGFVGRTQTIFKGFSDSITGYFNDTAKGILGAFTFGAAVGKLREFSAHAKQILEESKAQGISVETKQGFERLASKSAVDPELANNGIGKLNENIGQAANGSDEAAKKFEKWGIALADNQGRLKSTREILGEIMNKEKGTADAATRAAIAHDLMGKAGEKLVGVLMRGSAALDAEEHSWKTFTTSQLSDIAQYNKSLGLAAKSAELLWIKLVGGNLASPITQLSRAAQALSKFEFSKEGLKDSLSIVLHGMQAINEQGGTKIITEDQSKLIKETTDAYEKLLKLSDEITYSEASEAEQLERLKQDRQDAYETVKAIPGFALTTLQYYKAQYNFLEASNRLHKAELEISKKKAATQREMTELYRKEAEIRSELNDNFMRTSDEAAANGDPAALKLKQLQASAEEKRLRGDNVGAQADLQKVSDLRTGNYTENPSSYANDLRTADAAKRANMPGVENYYRKRAESMKQGVTNLKDSEKNNDPFVLEKKRRAELDERWNKILTDGGLKVLPAYSGGGNK